jgi:hypothetical protein
MNIYAVLNKIKILLKTQCLLRTRSKNYEIASTKTSSLMALQEYQEHSPNFSKSFSFDFIEFI